MGGQKPWIYFVVLRYSFIFNKIGALKERKKEGSYLSMKESYVAMSKYLLKALPLNSQVLKDIFCLGPVKREKEWTVNAIGRLVSMLPHIIAEREVSLNKDEWKILQTEEIPDDWYMENSGQQKRIDTYGLKCLKSALKQVTLSTLYLVKL